MTRIIQLTLAGLCVGLLFVIAAELVHMRGHNASPSLKAVAGTTAVKAPVTALDMEAAIAEILERPLFSPARHPPEVQFASNSEETSNETPPQIHGRLAGVMIRPGTREALFARVGQRPVAVKIGGEIDGWRIAAIEMDRVVLSSVFGTQTLRPTNDPKVVRAPIRPTNMSLGIGPAITSGTRGAMASIPNAKPSFQSSQVARQVEQ